MNAAALSATFLAFTSLSSRHFPRVLLRAFYACINFLRHNIGLPLVTLRTPLGLILVVMTGARIVITLTPLLRFCSFLIKFAPLSPKWASTRGFLLLLLVVWLGWIGITLFLTGSTPPRRMAPGGRSLGAPGLFILESQWIRRAQLTDSWMLAGLTILTVFFELNILVLISISLNFFVAF